MRRARFDIQGLAVLAAFVSTFTVAAHAELVSSEPSANAVTGSCLDIQLNFDGRIDSERSRLFIRLPNGERMVLTPLPGESESSLIAHAHDLPEGNAFLLYEVISVDGRITRDSLPFTVSER